MYVKMIRRFADGFPLPLPAREELCSAELSGQLRMDERLLQPSRRAVRWANLLGGGAHRDLASLRDATVVDVSGRRMVVTGIEVEPIYQRSVAQTWWVLLPDATQHIRLLHDADGRPLPRHTLAFQRDDDTRIGVLSIKDVHDRGLGRVTRQATFRRAGEDPDIVPALREATVLCISDGVLVVSGIVLRDLSRTTAAQCWEVRFGAGAASAPGSAEHFAEFA